MKASCQKSLPVYTPEINDQVIERSPQILISEKAYLELKSEVGYWQAMHKNAISREKELKQTIKELKGKIRDLRNRLFGKKSEKKSSSKDEGESKSSNPKCPRGQQRGSEGHGRTKRPDLPEKEEWIQSPKNGMFL